MKDLNGMIVAVACCSMFLGGAWVGQSITADKYERIMAATEKLEAVACQEHIERFLDSFSADFCAQWSASVQPMPVIEPAKKEVKK